MMATAEILDLAALYESDETAWLEIMAELVRAGRLDQIDAVNLAEFLDSMGKRDRREVTSRLTVLLAHLLKWNHQPAGRTRSWVMTVLEQRRELDGLFESATLRIHASEVLAKVYGQAIKEAAAETDLPLTAFPPVCPLTLGDILSQPLEGDIA